MESAATAGRMKPFRRMAATESSVELELCLGQRFELTWIYEPGHRASRRVFGEGLLQPADPPAVDRHIVIHEGDDLAGTLDDTPITCPRQSAPGFDEVPKTRDAEHHLTRALVGGSVVDYENFERSGLQITKRPDAALEIVRAVAGTHHHRHGGAGREGSRLRRWRGRGIERRDVGEMPRQQMLPQQPGRDRVEMLSADRVDEPGDRQPVAGNRNLVRRARYAIPREQRLDTTASFERGEVGQWLRELELDYGTRDPHSCLEKLAGKGARPQEQTVLCTYYSMGLNIWLADSACGFATGDRPFGGPPFTNACIVPGPPDVIARIPKGSG